MNQLVLLENYSRNKHFNTIRFPYHKNFPYVEGAVPRFLQISLMWAIGLMASLIFTGQAEAWEISTHRELTEKAIEFVASDLNTYLVDNLGLEGGLNASVDGMTAKKWMIEGSEFEDDWPRFFRHFHEPISNTGLGKSFDSSINWSLRQKGEQEWSWNDAREYYFKALTSPTKSERDGNWGKTFRALGQVMHLLQDSANPAHVRDDPHVLRDGLHDFMDRNSVASYTSAGIISPDSSMLEVAGAVRNEPFSNLFDRNMYQGSNPEVTLGTDVGITEYASANFFSDDRIAGQNSPVPPYPSVAELVPAPAPSPYLTLARLGSAAFPGARVARYTGNETLTQFLNLEFDLLGKLRLDDAVYDSYSSNLIPRAVGYSAAVLTYFFRGTIPIGFTEYCFQPGFQSTPPSTSFSIDVEISIPDQFQDGGEFYSYVDRPDGQRENMSGFVWESARLGIPFAMGGGFVGDDWGHPGPQRVTIVYKGKLGPLGAEEPSGVVGKTYEITNFIEPCLQ